MNQAPSKRGRARSVTFLVAAIAAAGVVVACVVSPRANGESCLKSQDCLSGLCLSGLCRAQPELLDAEPTASGDGSVLDTGTSGEASPGDAPAEAVGSKETGTGNDSGTKEDAAAETGPTDSGSSDSAVE